MVTSPSIASAALPFPAYGGPATDALTPRPLAGVSARITLTQAVAISAAASPTLEDARAALHLASSATELARVGLRPTITGDGSVSDAISPGQGLASAAAVATQSTSVSLTQLIFDGGQVVANVRSARAAEEGAAETYRRALQTLVFDVAQAYFAALAAESQTSLARQIVSQDVAQEQLISAQIDAGTAATIDLQTAHAATLQAQASVVTAQSQEIVALAQFVNVMGLDADGDVRPQLADTSRSRSSLPSGTPMRYDVAVVRALALRPDYFADIKLIESNDQKLRSARLGRSPTVSATALAGYDATRGYGTTQLQPQTSLVASVRVPFFDGGLSAANTAQAQALLEEATAAGKTQRLTVQVDVRTALAQLIAAQALLREDDDALTLARRVLDGRQIQYRAGKPVLLLFLNAQATYAAAQNARLSALYALRQAEQAYLYALGENDLGETTS